MALTTFQGPVRSLGGFYSQGPNSVLDITASATISPADHAGKLLLINNSTLTFTLPTINAAADDGASGPGADPNTLNNVGLTYHFLFLTSSGVSTTIQMNTAANLFTGSVTSGKAGLGLVHVFEPNGSSNNAMIFNGTTTGGVAGSYVSITAIYANKYLVQGTILGSATLATPFSG
jgi:hypothetical protein